MSIHDNNSYIDTNENNCVNVPGKYLDAIVCGDCIEVMRQLPESSIDCMITSPPYNVGKEYEHQLELDDYLSFTRNYMHETHRVLKVGGRMCINVCGTNRRPFIPLHSYISVDAIKIGFLMRGEIVWVKNTHGRSTAWGSWRSASNPVLTDTSERILVFSKGDYKKDGRGKKNTITSGEFKDWITGVWYFNTENIKRVKHPAPFPIELPSRLIKLYTFEGDVVMDPFVGSGTTAVAAKSLSRHYIGIDSSKEYCNLAVERLGVVQ
jgi:site-specific DNA-methyltransferase (adenine-specific)